MTQAADKKKLIIFDSNAVIHRAYHALPPLATKEGKVVGAVYGFLLVFLKAIADFSPDFIVAAFDLPAKTFRHKIYKDYKIKRPPAPKDLYSQIPIIKEVLGAFSVKIFEKEGFEADDIIATIANSVNREQKKLGTSVIILSGDSDTLQLVDSNTKVYVLRKGVKDALLYDEEMVKEKFGGITPRQLLDYKSLRGDSSDNIMGVPGIGEKTATELILNFGNLENIYKELKEKSEKSNKLKPKTKEVLLKNKEQSFFSRKLVQLEKNAPINFNLEECVWQDYNKEKVIKLLNDLDFYSLIKRLPETNKEKSAIRENLKLW